MSEDNTDYLGHALELESASKKVESQTAERAMLAGAHCLRIAEAARKARQVDTNTGAAAPQDERAAFEAWAKDRGYQRDELARSKIGLVSPEYFNLNTENTWKAWQARAALPAQAVTGDGSGQALPALDGNQLRVAQAVAKDVAPSDARPVAEIVTTGTGAQTWIALRTQWLPAGRHSLYLHAAQPAAQPADAITGHDLRTSAGGRGYVAEYFAKRLRRHDFSRYIAEHLAADFACVLARHLDGQPLRPAMTAKVAAADAQDAARWRWASELPENAQTLHTIMLCYSGDQAKINERTDAYRDAARTQEGAAS